MFHSVYELFFFITVIVFTIAVLIEKYVMMYSSVDSVKRRNARQMHYVAKMHDLKSATYESFMVLGFTAAIVVCFIKDWLMMAGLLAIILIYAWMSHARLERAIKAYAERYPYISK